MINLTIFQINAAQDKPKQISIVDTFFKFAVNHFFMLNKVKIVNKSQDVMWSFLQQRGGFCGREG